MIPTNDEQNQNRVLLFYSTQMVTIVMVISRL